MCGGRCICQPGACALRGHRAEGVWVDEPFEPGVQVISTIGGDVIATIDCDPATVPQGNSETALRLGIGEGR